MTKQPSKQEPIVAANGTLWGSSGGQLEFAGQKFVVRKSGNRVFISVILYFTDHDRWGCDDQTISGEIYAHYSLEVPVSSFDEGET